MGILFHIKTSEWVAKPLLLDKKNIVLSFNNLDSMSR